MSAPKSLLALSLWPRLALAAGAIAMLAIVAALAMG